MDDKTIKATYLAFAKTPEGAKYTKHHTVVDNGVLFPTEKEPFCDVVFSFLDAIENIARWIAKDYMLSAISKAGGPVGEVAFGAAIEAAKLGHKISRTGWNGSGLFVYIVPGNSYPAQTDAIKGEFDNDMIPYNEYWALRGPTGVSTWAPSGSDSLANDWVIHES